MTSVNMNTVLALLQAGLISILTNPLLYVGLLLIAWDLHRNTKDERKYFGVRVTRVWAAALSRWSQGLVIGLLCTVLCLCLGVTVGRWEVWVVACLGLILALIRVRFMAAPYAVGIVVVLSQLCSWLKVQPTSGWLSSVIDSVRTMRVEGWVLLLAISFLGESLLLLWNQRRNTPPAVVLGKRGRTIGALLIQLAFVVPIGVLTTGTHLRPTFAPSTWPWFGGVHDGYSVVALPVLVGMSAVMTTLIPPKVVRRQASNSLLLAIVLGIDAFVTHRYGSGFGLIGVMVAVFGREFTQWGINRTEARREPIFAQSADGVRVLGTLPGSLAESMGLLPGELITHINQVAVHSVYDLHFAFEQNPAYAKLHVLDLRGEPRILGKPVYAGERSKLGLIVAPDGLDASSSTPVKSGLLQTLYMGSRRRRVSDDVAPAHTADSTATTQL